MIFVSAGITEVLGIHALFGAFLAGAVFLLANGGEPATGWVRHLEQAYFAAVFGAYFLYCWLRGGQTLAMRAWRIRLVAPGCARVPVRRALLRLAYAAVLLGAFLAAIIAAFVHRNPWLAFASLALTGVGLGWVLVDRDRQFLHDRLAGTRLVLVPRPVTRG
ncbi:MAG: RDD family protein [Betaproteobacteria bacterium]|nr:RDD family protein [Betaproteobacteria bacterium]